MGNRGSALPADVTIHDSFSNTMLVGFSGSFRPYESGPGPLAYVGRFVVGNSSQLHAVAPERVCEWKRPLKAPKYQHQLWGNYVT